MASLLMQQHSIGLKVMAGLLSLSDCESLIDIGKKHLQKAQVLDDNTGTSVDHYSRVADMAWPKRSDYPLLQNLAAWTSKMTGIPVEHQEPLQILHYPTGGEYKPHFDAFKDGSSAMKNGGNRVATLILYLNTVMSGGSTSFPELGIEVNAIAGNGVYYFNLDQNGRQNPLSLHAGMPVLDGEKWIATCWIREKAYV